MVVEKITMPQLGESVTEGTVNTWLVEVGDTVEKYDPIVDIMTDKVSAEVPSSFAGVIKEIVTAEGETIRVGEVMCLIEVEAESKESPSHETPEHQTEAVAQTAPDQSMRGRYSPAVLKMAQEHELDLSTISGTGKSGRITRKDLEAIIKHGSRTHAAEKTMITEQPPTKTPQPQNISHHGDIEIPVTGVRRAVAANLVKSKQEIPHAWMTVEVDVTELVKLRQAQKADFYEREGFNLTYFAFFMKAVAQALKEFPQLNSVWAGDKIIQRRDVNLSLAVANEDELYVPVIHNADDKSIKGMAQAIHHLAKKARTQQLTTEDMSGGTFTVNNTGSFGSIHSMGIINYPQAAILQVEAIVKRPMIINEMFAARDMVNLSLSLDHRILDGLVCGRFLARVKEILEGMSQETTAIY